MQKIIESIHKRPINLILIFMVIVLYVLNNIFFKAYSKGIVNEFCICYLNDLLCPFFFFSYANLLLITCNREMVKLPILLAIGIIVGFVWEYVAPLMKKGSVTDYGDLLCYIIGTAGYWFILTLSRKRSNNCVID